MKRWIINGIYVAAWTAMLPLIVWRRLAAGRSFGNPLQRLLGLVPFATGPKPVIWLHAVSVGEVNQLQTLIEQLRADRPGWQFVISTTTATGMELARKKHPDIRSFFFPIDFSWAINNALRRLRPALIVLTELELWPNLIDRAWQGRIPVVVINGRLSERSFRGYQRIARLVRPMFARLTMVVTQDDEYAGRFVALGVPAAFVRVVGSIKYDNAARQAATVQRQGQRQLDELQRLVKNRPGDRLLVAGSTQEPEEQLIAAVWQKLASRFPELRLAIVPRHPHRAAAIARQLESDGVPVIFRSAGGRATSATTGRISTGGKRDRPPVLLVDTIGELGACWALADIAFVGGSFGTRGGQNMLEPAAAGTAVCFGPNTRNFATIVTAMKQADACCEVESGQLLFEFARRCLEDPDYRIALGKRAARFVGGQSGACRRTAELLIQIDSGSSTLPATVADKAA
jgi:3-deoxy-D-manno-octulosonic-acid transferase